MNLIRQSIRQILLNFGWDVRRVRSYDSEKRRKQAEREIERWKLLRAYAPQAVLDIGANTGQFASIARRLLPETEIISFEPLSECYSRLSEQQGALAPLRCFPFALGNENGIASMNRNEFSPSSSILEMQTLHKEELPFTSHTEAETIEIRRLDDLASSLSLPSRYVAKIDVQGYSIPVLLGGEMTFRSACAIVVEVSLQPLYDGETTFDAAYDLMKSWGFSYKGNIDQWVSSRTGQILQCDCLFENQNECERPQ